MLKQKEIYMLQLYISVFFCWLKINVLVTTNIAGDPDGQIKLHLILCCLKKTPQGAFDYSVYL